MRFIHFSDLHLDSRSDVIYGVDTVDNLRRAVKRMNDVAGIDFAILSGDISNDGSATSYLLADCILSELYFPVYATLGNHDNRTAYAECADRFSKLSALRIFNCPEGVRFIFLDSVWPDEIDGNKSRGFLSERELLFLDQQLSDPKASVIVMHHPCVSPGGWMDRRILSNSRSLISAIESKGNVLAVLAGHNHSSFTCLNGGTLYSVAPATGTTYGISLKPYEEAFCPGFDVFEYASGKLTKSTVNIG